MSEVEDIEFIAIIEDGSSASDPLTYPPWDPEMHTHRKYQVGALTLNKSLYLSDHRGYKIFWDPKRLKSS
jgi:hypothetical protein